MLTSRKQEAVLATIALILTIILSVIKHPARAQVIEAEPLATAAVYLPMIAGDANNVATATQTPVSTPTATPTSTPTATSLPSATPTSSPTVTISPTASLEEAILRAAQSAPLVQQRYPVVIEQTHTDGVWAVALVRIDVPMAEVEQVMHPTDKFFVLAQQANEQWVAITDENTLWGDWLDQLPDSVIDHSLREYLLDHHVAEVYGASISANLPDLKLPWLPKNNPQSISGSLYNEGWHKDADAFAMDWGMNNQDVVAVAGGTVVELRCDLPNQQNSAWGYGNYVQMDIGNGILAIYAHLQSCTVGQGQWHPQGTVVGKSGTSGNSSGPHLHFRLRTANRQPVRAEPISGYASIQKWVSYNSNNGIQSPPVGKIQVVEGLNLSDGRPIVNENVRATFKIRNVGGQTVTVQQLTAGARRGGGWDGENVDFPKVSNISLQPGEEYAYSQERSFGIEGNYFAEPVALINGNWGGIGNANRVQFSVVQGGRLEVVGPLSLSNQTPAVDEVVRATFRIRNVGNQPLGIEQLAAGGRRGTGWDGEWADFPSATNIVLQPGQEYTYQQERSFATEGGYFAEPVVKLNGRWGGISHANRVGFTVAARGRLQVVEALTLSSVTPSTNEQVRARFKVKNVGNQALVIEQLAAGGRRGSDWNDEWADFPNVYNITLQPGQEYTYEQQRSFALDGGYFAEAVVMIAGRWGGISNANRVQFSVRLGIRLQVVETLHLSTNSPTVGQAVRARFKVKNTGGQAVTLEQLTAGGRRGTSWDDELADFPSVSNITLQPGQEYLYDQERSFATEGGYFAEPVVKIAGHWGGIEGANRVAFAVRLGGRLQVAEALTLSSTDPTTGDTVRARFKIKNTGAQSITIEQLTAGGRRGNNWDGEWADFPSVFNITLQPGQEYVYEQQRDFDVAGSYFAEPVVKIAGHWGGIEGANRVAFTVQLGGRLSVVEALSLSSTNPTTGQAVRARFKLKNIGARPVLIAQLTAGGRRGNDWDDEWADFPSVFDILLQPGQEYVYEQQRNFTVEGSYFAEPVVRLGDSWGGIAGANRVSFIVRLGGRLQVVEALSLLVSNPSVGETVRARFKIKNTGTEVVVVEQMAAAGRRGTNWDGDWADFPSVFNLTIQPGQEYAYEQSRIFDVEGSYFAEPAAKIDGNWGEMENGNRVQYAVQAGLRVVANVSLTPANPQRGQPVVAQFRIKNFGNRTITIQRLLAAGRGPNCNDWECANHADFPVSLQENIILTPNQEYAYSENRTFEQAGSGYFVEPLLLTANGWVAVPGGSRVNYSIN